MLSISFKVALALFSLWGCGYRPVEALPACEASSSQELLYTLPPASICSDAASLYQCNVTFTDCLVEAERMESGCDQLTSFCLTGLLRCVNEDLLKLRSEDLCPWASKTHTALIAFISEPNSTDFSLTSLSLSCEQVACSIKAVYNSSCSSSAGDLHPDPCSRLQYRTATLTESSPPTNTPQLTVSRKLLSVTKSLREEPSAAPTPVPPYNFSSDLNTIDAAETVLVGKVSESLMGVNPVIPVLPGCPTWFSALASDALYADRADSLFQVALTPGEAQSLVPAASSGSSAESAEAQSNELGQIASSESTTGSAISTPEPSLAATPVVGYLTRDELSTVVSSVFQDYSVDLGLMNSVLYELEGIRTSLQQSVDQTAEAALNKTEKTMLVSTLTTEALLSEYSGCMMTPSPPSASPTPMPPSTALPTNITTALPDVTTTAAPSLTPAPSVTDPPVEDVTLPPAQRIIFEMKIKNLPAEPFLEDQLKEDLCAAEVYNCYTNELIITYQSTVEDGTPVYLDVEFRGVRALELQQRASALASGSTVLLDIGVLSVQAAPVIATTEAPTLLERSSSLVWIAGAGCLGGAMLIGALVWCIRDRAAKKRKYQDVFNDYNNELPMLQAPGEHSE